MKDAKFFTHSALQADQFYSEDEVLLANLHDHQASDDRCSDRRFVIEFD